MTEAAVVLPVLVVLALQAGFLTDLVRARLRGLETARFVAWERAASRPEPAALEEARRRLAGGAEGHRRLGLSVLSLTLSVAEAEPPDGASAGTAVPPGLWRLVEGARLPATGWVTGRAEVRMDHGWVPGEVTFTVQRTLPYGSWKGWPGPRNRLGQTDGEADPRRTYDVAEATTAAQVDALAFAGLGRLPGLDVIERAARAFGLPDVLDASPGADGGPVTLGPADPVSAAPFAPAAHLRRATRLGDRIGPSVFTVDTPEPGVDRSRYSLPFRLGSGHWWNTSGGYRHKPLPELLRGYEETHACRGPFQDGAVRADVPPRRAEAWDGCDGAADPADAAPAPPSGLFLRGRP